MLIVTPYSLSSAVHAAHDGFGTLLFITQLGVAIWLTTRSRRPIDVLLVLTQLAGGIAALISLPDYWTLEVPGQLIFQLAFVALVWRHLE